MESTIFVLSLLTFGGQANNFAPLGRRIRTDLSATNTNQESDCHGVGFLGDSGEARDVTNTDARLVEDPQRIGTDRPRELCCLLELDGERHQYLRQQGGQRWPSWHMHHDAPSSAKPVQVGKDAIDE